MAKTAYNAMYFGDAIVKTYDDGRRTLAIDTEGNSYKNLTASSTTYLASGAGVLRQISLNTNGGTVTIYDSTTESGTTIGTIAADAPEGVFLEDIAFDNGLTVVTGATVNVTVAFRSDSEAVRSMSPSLSPSISPSVSSSLSPSISPSLSPSISPSASVSLSPSISPSLSPSLSPSISPSESPSLSPSISPSPS